MQLDFRAYECVRVGSATEMTAGCLACCRCGVSPLGRGARGPVACINQSINQSVSRPAGCALLNYERPVPGMTGQLWISKTHLGNTKSESCV